MDDNRPLYLWTINERGKLDRRVIKDWEKVIDWNGKGTFYRFKDKLYRIQDINENDLDKYRYHRMLTFNGSYDNAWKIFNKALFADFTKTKFKADVAEQAYNTFREKNRKPT